MDDHLWCPNGHQAREPKAAGRFAAVCACGMRFTTRPGAQAAYRVLAGTEVSAPERDAEAGTVLGASGGLILHSWPEPGPAVIPSVPPREAGAQAKQEDASSTQRAAGSLPSTPPQDSCDGWPAEEQRSVSDEDHENWDIFEVFFGR